MSPFPASWLWKKEETPHQSESTFHLRQCILCSILKICSLFFFCYFFVFILTVWFNCLRQNCDEVCCHTVSGDWRLSDSLLYPQWWLLDLTACTIKMFYNHFLHFFKSVVCYPWMRHFASWESKFSPYISHSYRGIHHMLG